ncbi:MAG: D-glycero-beta-D-manno-heptose-7-phosphate kinase [Dehalococcoidales bacterium]|nr:D-glycero-beta-D-manno-heptose-7-phosphate kinase [Dehalococcoidales bacterium]
MSGDLTKILAGLKNLRILVIGDAMLDEYVSTVVERISPEAPIPVARITERSCVLGGAANVANNLIELGSNVDLLCVIGDDDNGRKLTEQATRRGINPDGIFVDSAKLTTTKTRIISQGQQMIRIDNESTQPILADLEQRIIQFVMGNLETYDGIIISDYLKGLLTESLVRRLIDLSRKSNKPILVDPKGNWLKKYVGATVVTPNKKETETVYGREIHSEQDFRDAASHLLKEAQCEAILITRGKDGMSLYQSDGKYEHIYSRVKEVYDVTGAGDTVSSVFGLALFSCYSYSEAAHIANIAGGIVVGKVGTATVSVSEIANYIGENINPSSSKIKSLEQLIVILDEKRKKKGKKIVFTNGCFDLLHIGHIKLLEQAKNLGDELVVAVNSDSSVRALKGEDRAFVPELDRAYIISALSCVDYVVIFSEPTPERLISELRPDILVKGADYEREEIVGREFVESYGGRVEQIPLVEGISTSSLIRRVKSTK